MAQDDTSVLLVVVIVAIALVGVGLSVFSMTSGQSFNNMMGGRNGMMGQTNVSTQTTASPGAVEWMVLVVSLLFLGLAVVLFARGRMRPSAPVVPGAVTPTAAPRVDTQPPAPVPASAVVPTPAPVAVPSTVAPPPAAQPVPEPALMKLLDQDERTMYLEIRDHGGTMLQRDLVALGIFSKAKVTRVLDRLEAKDLVVREAHGMTNRVRILNHAK